MVIKVVKGKSNGNNCSILLDKNIIVHAAQNYSFSQHFLHFSENCNSRQCGILHSAVMMMIPPNCHARKEGRKGKEGGEGGVGKNLRGGGGQCWLQGNGAAQSAICCTMCKRG